ncbi:MAG: amino acid transport protein [Verrucomicrobiota bacterium]
MSALLLAGVLFGSIGMGAFVYGKKRASAVHMILGALLMGYPYFVSGVQALIGIGVGLTIALFLFKTS